MAAAGGEGVGRGIVLRDLEFRHKLTEELAKVTGAMTGSGDVKECIEILNRPAIPKATAGMRSGRSGVGAAQGEKVGMEAIKQIKEMLPDFGEGFVS